jgi:DNA-binding SARP family transcriptional activator
VPGVALQLLGRFQVRRDGEEVPPGSFGGRKVRALLRVLAVRRPDLVPHAVLAEALWPDRQPADPVANLNVLVNRARRALGDPGAVTTGTGGYALGPCTVDVADFLAAAERSRVDDDAVALRECLVALALWGEPLAEDTYADWAQEPRARLFRTRVEVLERAARAALASGDARRAAGWAADALAAEPLRESAAVLLARALARSGDPAGALARLAALRTRLADELGVDPSPEVESLQLALLRGEVPVVARVAVPVPGRPTPFGELSFVGRDDELARLCRAVDSGEVVTLAGVAGVGKSRLLAELARRSSLPVLVARAVLPERAEAWGLARSLLREALATDPAMADGLAEHVRGALAGLLPELGAAVAVDGESRRALLLAGGLRVLEAAAGSGGALLLVDDLQWADPSSLVLLGSALARLPQLAAVLAFRPDELAPDALSGVRSARPGVAAVTLGPLADTAVNRLVGDGPLAAAILDATDRTPFAVAELLRELAARDAVAPEPGGGWRSRRPDAPGLAADLGRAGQRRAVGRRAQRQTGPRADALALLALLAREAPASTVAVAAGLDHRTALDALSALAAAGLVRLGEQGWATAHDLVAETVTGGLEAAERGRLHGVLARALEAEGADPSEIARHHRGAGDPESAAATFASAAHRALATHATREAAALADAGLALAPRASVRADLLAVRAEAAATHGASAAAVTDLQEALALTGAGPDRALRLSRLAMITSGARDPLRASELVELALVEAGGDAAARAVALETAAIIDMNLDRPDRSADRAETALELYRGLGDARGVARILDGRAMATFLDGRITAAVETFARVAQLFRDSGELLRVITPRSTRGHGLVFCARPADGLADCDLALGLARDLDATEGQAYALWHRSEALSGLGRHVEAEADAREALAVARGADHRGWTATAYRAWGIALAGRGELDDAAVAFAASGERAGESLTLFASWAAARSALVDVARGRLDSARALAARAVAIGPPLGHYEARLAEVEVLAARADPGCGARCAAALALARDGGHVVTAVRLAELSGVSGILAR